MNHGTPCTHPSSPAGGVTPSSRTSVPPWPEAGRATDAQSSLGRSGIAGSDGEFDTHPASLHDPFTMPARPPQWAVPAGQVRVRVGADGAAGEAAGAHPAKARPQIQPAAAVGRGRDGRELLVNSSVMFTPSGGGAGDARLLPRALEGRRPTRGGAVLTCDRSSSRASRVGRKGEQQRIASTGAEEAASVAQDAGPPRPGTARARLGARQRARDRRVAARAQPARRGGRRRGRRRHRRGAPSRRPTRTTPAPGHPRRADRQAVTLAHSLADERDEVTAYIAAGRAPEGRQGRPARSLRRSERPRRPAGRRDPRPSRRPADLRPTTWPSSPQSAAQRSPARAPRSRPTRRTPPPSPACTASPTQLAEKTPPRAAHGTRRAPPS